MLTDTIPSSKGKLVDLGSQITNAAIQAATFLKDKEGRNLVFTVARGQPAHLIGYELTNNTLIVDLPLDSMVGAWSIAGSSDGVLYFGGDLGHLYKYTPGDAQAVSLGLPLGDQTYTWDLKAGSNGEIFGFADVI